MCHISPASLEAEAPSQGSSFSPVRLRKSFKCKSTIDEILQFVADDLQDLQLELKDVLVGLRLKTRTRISMGVAMTEALHI